VLYSGAEHSSRIQARPNRRLGEGTMWGPGQTNPHCPLGYVLCKIKVRVINVVKGKPPSNNVMKLCGHKDSGLLARARGKILLVKRCQ
jgi:hypothetical protein